MQLLLDTCTFLWMVADEGQLSPRARDLLEDGGNTLLLHQASIWEIQIKYQRGKLALSEKPQTFISEGLRLHQIDCAPLSTDAIWLLDKLPDYHGDPFDRILIASALCAGLEIVTPDPLIHRYPIRAIW